MKTIKSIVIIAIALLAAISCSTTRVLQDDEYRLAKNRINVVNDKKFNDKFKAIVEKVV